LAIFIGPEGDFSEQEVSLMMERHIVPVSLGNTRLRTETAAVLSCTLVQTASLVKYNPQNELHQYTKPIVQ